MRGRILFTEYVYLEKVGGGKLKKKGERKGGCFCFYGEAGDEGAMLEPPPLIKPRPPPRVAFACHPATSSFGFKKEKKKLGNLEVA